MSRSSRRSGEGMNADRIVTQLDKMVDAGRMTEDEAQCIRAARGTPEFEETVLNVRVRHASERLDAAVANGEMSRAEADGRLQRVRMANTPRAFEHVFACTAGRITPDSRNQSGLGPDALHHVGPGRWRPVACSMRFAPGPINEFRVDPVRQLSRRTGVSESAVA